MLLTPGQGRLPVPPRRLLRQEGPALEAAGLQRHPPDLGNRPAAARAQARDGQLLDQAQNRAVDA